MAQVEEDGLVVGVDRESLRDEPDGAISAIVGMFHTNEATVLFGRMGIMCRLHPRLANTTSLYAVSNTGILEIVTLNLKNYTPIIADTVTDEAAQFICNTSHPAIAEVK